MDGRPNRRNKAVFSNFSSVVYTGSKYTIKAKQWKVNLASDDSKTLIYLLGMGASDEETSLLDIWREEWH